ncbi:hypothetical protein AC1031_007986 [Aphanomyces cochlioides]|nr:hypothetical protein AC1031_007986 [Aphanomyces cochlioides]
MDPPEQPQQQVVERKKRFIFKDNHDELLLLEVLGDNGFFTHGVKKSEAWAKIENNLRLLGVEATAHKENASKAASGVVETLTKKKRLLQEYHDALMDEKEAKLSKKVKSAEVDNAIEIGGKALRDAAMMSMDTKQSSESKSNKLSLNTIFESLNESKMLEFDFRKRDLDLRQAEAEAKQDLKRRRIEIDLKNAENQSRALALQEQQMKLQANLIAILQSFAPKEQ